MALTNFTDRGLPARKNIQFPNTVFESIDSSFRTSCTHVVVVLYGDTAGEHAAEYAHRKVEDHTYRRVLWIDVKRETELAKAIEDVRRVLCHQTDDAQREQLALIEKFSQPTQPCRFLEQSSEVRRSLTFFSAFKTRITTNDLMVLDHVNDVPTIESSLRNLSCPIIINAPSYDIADGLLEGKALVRCPDLGGPVPGWPRGYVRALAEKIFEMNYLALLSKDKDCWLLMRMMALMDQDAVPVALLRDATRAWM